MPQQNNHKQLQIKMKLKKHGLCQAAGNVRVDLSALLDNISSMVCYWDTELHNCYANQAYLNWFGMPGPMCGVHMRDMLGDSLFEQTLPHIEAVLRGEAQTFERALLSPDTNQYRHARVEFIPDMVEGGVQGFYAHISDTTPFNKKVSDLLEQHERDLFNEKESAELTRRELDIAVAAFEMHEGIMITDLSGVILRINQLLTEATGYSAEELVGKTPNTLKSGRHDAAFYAAIWHSLKSDGNWQGEIWNRRKDGKIFSQWVTISAVRASGGEVTHYVSNHTDISIRKNAEAEIRFMAFYDPLTQLPNRRLLIDRLQQAQLSCKRTGKWAAMLFIDLDNFKAINDTDGHDIGDQLLLQVAARLHDCVREGDTLARFGGDEFVILLEDLNVQELEAAAETKAIGRKIIDVLNQSYQLAERVCSNTPSVGVILFQGQPQTTDELCKQADIAMYEAKDAGGNTLRFFDPRMQDEVNARVRLEAELRQALDNQELNLFYQMQVNSSGRQVGAEALIRWHHPERGLVTPFDFIPLAEETGLILPIGSWVLDTACAQIKTWQQSAASRDLVLAVNVSARQFDQPDFVEQIHACVQRHAIPPALLKLELTESMLVKDIEIIITKISALKALGVGVSLDDFGTGYSSLQYLKKLPFDQLKIDQSFVRELSSDKSDQLIVRTIVGMANSMGLGVIAEGVETEEQRQMLLSQGCMHFQGYLFGRPMPLAQFQQTLVDYLSVTTNGFSAIRQDAQ